MAVERVEFEGVAEASESGDAAIIIIEVERSEIGFGRLVFQGDGETAHAATKIKDSGIRFNERLGKVKLVLLKIFLIEAAVEPFSKIGVSGVRREPF